jgi:molecular chaperone HscB
METKPHTESRDPAPTPLRCRRCQSEMTWPVVCEACHTLYPPREQVDYFELLGVPRRYDLDLEKLRRNFLALNRRIHPDFFSTEEDDVQNASMRIAAQINTAYETLRDPVQRAEYILHVCGGPGRSEDKSVPAELLGAVMTLRDQIDEARQAGDQAALKALNQQVTARYQEVMGRVRALAGRVCDSASEPERFELRQQLNAGQYWSGLLRHLNPS